MQGIVLDSGPCRRTAASARRRSADEAEAKGRKGQVRKAQGGETQTATRRSGGRDDPLTEWELVNGAAMEARARLKKARKPEPIRQQIAELAVRSAVGAERALAISDASLFDSYRTQFREQFGDTRWRLVGFDNAHPGTRAGRTNSSRWSGCWKIFRRGRAGMDGTGRGVRDRD
jgi:hypothetical protein